MPYIGTSPSNGVRRVHTYTATASQTTFSGASSEGVTLSYADTNYIDVFQNGVLLGSADYTSTSGTSVVLAQGASADDLIVIVVYDVFSVADTVSKTNGGSFDNGITINEDGATVLTVDRATSDGTIVDLQKDGSAVGSISTEGSRLAIGTGDVGLKFDSGLNQLIPFDISSNAVNDDVITLGRSTSRFKNLYLSGGIYLGGTGSANLLSDYEEGTWTPSLNSYSGTPTFSNAVYVKSGNFVLAAVRVELDGTADASRFEVAGLPFTVANTTNSVFGGGVSYTNSTFSRNIYVLVNSNGTKFGVYEEGASNLSYTEVGVNKEIRFFVLYRSQ